jgi:hypothetical protein
MPVLVFLKASMTIKPSLRNRFPSRYIATGRAGVKAPKPQGPKASRPGWEGVSRYGP